MNSFYYHGEQQFIDDGSKPLAGKRICALGDSNTQYMAADLSTRIVELTGCAYVRNEGHAGCKWGYSSDDPDTTDGGHGISMVNKLVNPYKSQGYANQFDIITFMYGTNSDVGGLGTRASTDVSTTWGAMKYCFDKMLYYYRYGKIGVLLAPQRAGGVMTDTINAIKECCELYSVPYYDMSGQGQIASDDKMALSFEEQGLSGYGNAYFQDNVHFSTIGKEQFYHKYARFLESLI
jgi:hypothetical protein